LSSITPNKSPEVFDVEIAGLPLKLKTSHSEEFVLEVVSVVNSKIEDCLKLTKSGSIQMAAILACVNLSEELLSIKEVTGQEIVQLRSKAHKLVSQLEVSLNS